MWRLQELPEQAGIQLANWYWRSPAVCLGTIHQFELSQLPERPPLGVCLQAAQEALLPADGPNGVLRGGVPALWEEANLRQNILC